MVPDMSATSLHILLAIARQWIRSKQRPPPSSRGKRLMRSCATGRMDLFFLIRYITAADVGMSVRFRHSVRSHISWVHRAEYPFSPICFHSPMAPILALIPFDILDDVWFYCVVLICLGFVPASTFEKSSFKSLRRFGSIFCRLPRGVEPLIYVEFPVAVLPQSRLLLFYLIPS